MTALRTYKCLVLIHSSFLGLYVYIQMHSYVLFSLSHVFEIRKSNISHCLSNAYLLLHKLCISNAYQHNIMACVILRIRYLKCFLLKVTPPYLGYNLTHPYVSYAPCVTDTRYWLTHLELKSTNGIWHVYVKSHVAFSDWMVIARGCLTIRPFMWDVIGRRHTYNDGWSDGVYGPSDEDWSNGW